jgi:hypothetical protein
MQIALIGTTQSRLRAPYDDPSWLIVGHASGHCIIPRADVWFELHTPTVRSQPKTWDAAYQTWLAGTGRAEPILLQAADAAIPQSETFPRAEIETWARAHGLIEAPYFTSTVAWMLAWALWKGATRIGLWGINFSQTQEYRVQRPCVEYWIGVARARGVHVEIATTSPLCRSKHVYGFDGSRRDLARDLPMAPKRLIVVRPGVALPPLTPIPSAIQALIDEEQDRYQPQRAV